MNAKRSNLLSLLICLVSGCAGGPPHHYYSPVSGGTSHKFKGPIILALVDDINVEKEKRLKDGYVLIGHSDYRGQYPEASELRAQAKRAHANYVLWSCQRAEGQAAFRFSFRRAPWERDPLSEDFNVRIAFLGKN
jgi:hypothetical protein